jgi:hypothetical protein
MATTECCQFAKILGCNDFEFSPGDAGWCFYTFWLAVIEAGAMATPKIPNTTGWNMPREFGGLIKQLQENVKGVDKMVFSRCWQLIMGVSIELEVYQLNSVNEVFKVSLLGRVGFISSLSCSISCSFFLL